MVLNRGLLLKRDVWELKGIIILATTFEQNGFWKGWSPYTNTFKYILVDIYVISNIILIATAKEIGQSQE
jgi:hypothetical protein